MKFLFMRPRLSRGQMLCAGPCVATFYRWLCLYVNVMSRLATQWSHDRVMMSWHAWAPIRGPASISAANQKQRPGHERMGSVISAHITQHYTVFPRLGPHDPDTGGLSFGSRILLGIKVFDGSTTWGLSSALPLARHKNEDEVTEAITRSDGSDQLWATYGIQIVNCVRYPPGTRKYSILVWSSTKHILMFSTNVRSNVGVRYRISIHQT